jgi:ABC-type branched-subunit amino acid transport system substrate-binding protein
MTVFHRFYAAFPLFPVLLLLVLFLGGCAGGGQSAWETRGSSAKDGGVYTGAPAALPVQADAGTVRVAILLPLTGQHAAMGQSMLQAAQLSIFDMGYDNFELIPQDTGGTAYGASSAAATALQSGAQLILGPLFAEEVRAVKSATAGRNINVIAFSTDWTLAGGNTYIMGFLPFGQVDRIVDYAAARGLKRAAVAAGADQYGTAVSRDFETKAAGKGIAISRALSDPNAYDSVFIPAGGRDLTSILQRVSRRTAQKLGTGLWDDARVAALPDMNGAWFAAPSPSARASFETRYQSTYGETPVRLATMAYDATALAQALAKSGLTAGRGPAYDAASLTASSGFAGVDGIIRFNKQNLVERGMAVLSIQNGRIVEIDPAPRSFSR